MQKEQGAKSIGCGGILVIMFVAAFLMFFMRSCVRSVFISEPPKASASQDGLDLYRSNIGKTAYNATNGVEIGRIVGVEITRMNGPEQIVYKVDRGGRIMLSPVSNVVAR
jgi:hypothetical protein